MKAIYFLLLFVLFSEQTPYDINPGSTYATRLKSLSPGDVVTFKSGIHTGENAKVAFTLNGTPSQPIIIQGENGAIISKGSGQNIWDFQGSNFIIRNLVFKGGSRGLRLGEVGNVTNALFENLFINGTADSGFTMNQPGRLYEDITIRNVEISYTGTGTSECFYLGCNNNDCVIRNSLIEKVYCHDTTKALATYGAGIQIKTGSYNNTIRDSVFWNLAGVGVFVYDDYDLGANTIEGNVIVASGDHGIQFTAGAIVKNNIVINPALSGIAGIVNQPKSGTLPRNIQVLHNTVVIGSTSEACLRGNSWGTNAATITVANNAFFCEGKEVFRVLDNQANAKWFNNGYIGSLTTAGIPSGGLFVLDPIATETQAPASRNYYPKSTSKLVNAGSTSNTVTRDYNCLARSGTPTVGAYHFGASTNPGSAIQMGFKQCVASGTTAAGATTDQVSGTTGTSSGSVTTTGQVSSTTTSNGSTTGSEESGAVVLIISSLIYLIFVTAIMF